MFRGTYHGAHIAQGALDSKKVGQIPVHVAKVGHGALNGSGVGQDLGVDNRGCHGTQNGGHFCPGHSG